MKKYRNISEILFHKQHNEVLCIYETVNTLTILAEMHNYTWFKIYKNRYCDVNYIKILDIEQTQLKCIFYIQTWKFDNKLMYREINYWGRRQ